MGQKNHQREHRECEEVLGGADRVNKPQPRPVTWAYGVTTVPERKDDLLVQTLHSLCDAGFGDPHLFVDGCDDPTPYKVFGGLISCRPNPPVKIVGNWVMGMWELYVRNPTAHRFVMFQDDIQTVGNLREYLESCPYPKKGYLNLYTHDENRKFTKNESGWCLAMQRGLGALGLIFDREALQILLGSTVIVHKPTFAGRYKSWKTIDGAISQAMKNLGWKEYVHNPSLLQHWGIESTLKNKGQRLSPIDSFPGQEFDVMQFNKKGDDDE